MISKGVGFGRRPFLMVHRHLFSWGRRLTRTKRSSTPPRFPGHAGLPVCGRSRAPCRTAAHRFESCLISVLSLECPRHHHSCGIDGAERAQAFSGAVPQLSASGRSVYTAGRQPVKRPAAVSGAARRDRCSDSESVLLRESLHPMIENRGSDALSASNRSTVQGFAAEIEFS
jgi:hypothetical protein